MKGILLLAHGSRGPAWRAPFERLREKVLARQPAALGENVYLEHTEPTAAVAAIRLVDRGATAIEIIPLFLGPGWHVRSDLPRLADEIRSAHPSLIVSIAAPIGDADAVLDAIAGYCLRPE